MLVDDPTLLGLLEFGFVLEGVLDDSEPTALPLTSMLSTTLRLPANDCAIRFASSRSFCEGAEPAS